MGFFIKIVNIHAKFRACFTKCMIFSLNIMLPGGGGVLKALLAAQFLLVLIRIIS